MTRRPTTTPLVAKMFAACVLLAAATAVSAQTMLAPLPVVQYQFFNAVGTPLAGGKICTYLAGTSTPSATYSDYAGLHANTNPVVLNGAGIGVMYLFPHSYKIVAQDSSGTPNVCDGAVQWTQDNVYDYGQLLALSLASSVVTSNVTTTTLSFQLGSSCGNNATGNNGVVLLCDQIFTNPDTTTSSIEARLESMVVRRVQTHYPELGADEDSSVAAATIEAGTTGGTINGQLKARTSELYLFTPSGGSGSSYTESVAIGEEIDFPVLGTYANYGYLYGAYVAPVCTVSGAGCQNNMGSFGGGFVKTGGYGVYVAGMTDPPMIADRAAVKTPALTLDGAHAWFFGNLQENQDGSSVYYLASGNDPLQAGMVWTGGVFSDGTGAVTWINGNTFETGTAWVGRTVKLCTSAVPLAPINSCLGGAASYTVTSVVDSTHAVLSPNPPNNAPAWSSGTTYALGAGVTYSAVRYVSLQNGNLNNTPVSSPTWWVVQTPTFTYAVIDTAQLRLPYQTSTPTITNFGLGVLVSQTSSTHSPLVSTLEYCDDGGSCVDVLSGSNAPAAWPVGSAAGTGNYVGNGDGSTPYFLGTMHGTGGSGNVLALVANGAEAARVGVGGRILAGATTTDWGLTGAGNLVLVCSGCGLGILNGSSNANGVEINTGGGAGSVSQISAVKTGTGTLGPLAFTIGGTEAFRINTSGQELFNETSAVSAATVVEINASTTSGALAVPLLLNLASGSAQAQLVMDVAGTRYGSLTANSTAFTLTANNGSLNVSATGGFVLDGLSSAPSCQSGNAVFYFNSSVGVNQSYVSNNCGPFLPLVGGGSGSAWIVGSSVLNVNSSSGGFIGFTGAGQMGYVAGSAETFTIVSNSGNPNFVVQPNVTFGFADVLGTYAYGPTISRDSDGVFKINRELRTYPDRTYVGGNSGLGCKPIFALGPGGQGSTDDTRCIGTDFPADTGNRYILYTSGYMSWGDGIFADGQDVNLYRASANVLQTDFNLYVGKAGSGGEVRINNDSGFLSIYNSAGTTRSAHIQAFSLASMTTPGLLKISNDLANQLISFYTQTTEFVRFDPTGLFLLVGAEERLQDNNANRTFYNAGGTITGFVKSANGDAFRINQSQAAQKMIFNVASSTYEWDVGGNSKATLDGSGNLSINGVFSSNSNTGGAGTVHTSNAGCQLTFVGGLYVSNNGSC